MEGVDVNNAYLYNPIDTPIIMEQPTDSTQKLAEPDFYCLFHMSLYGARQAGMVWGSVIHNDLKFVGF